MERKATKAGSQKKKKKQQIRTEPQKVQSSLNLLACSWHFLCLCTYVAIYWYDDKIYRECPKPDVYFKDSDTFGGRWKYLTAITLRTMMAYFCVAFVNDFLTKFSSFVGWWFTTIVWPLAWVVTIFFWVMYAIDREDVYPAVLDEYIPVLLNICWHVVLFPVVILEVLIVKHRYQSHSVALATMFFIGAGYTAWIIIIHSKTGRWAYPFMEQFNYLGFCIFALISFLIGSVFYYIGRGLATIRWGRNLT